MEEKDQRNTDPRLDTPAESNREKHINFREVEEESSEEFAVIHTPPADRQKQWQEGIEEGKKANRESKDQSTPSAMPMDEDDTLGIP